MKEITAQELIDRFDLKPHPEGGYFRETYRSDLIVKNRNCSTAIYFLIPKDARSCLHRIASDEIWHFYLGDPLKLIEISPAGDVKKTTLGQDIASGHLLQHVVPAGHWFGAYPADGGRYSFVGCTVAPGFDFQDFELGDRKGLLKRFPDARSIIELLTPELSD